MELMLPTMQFALTIAAGLLPVALCRNRGEVRIGVDRPLVEFLDDDLAAAISGLKAVAEEIHVPA